MKAKTSEPDSADLKIKQENSIVTGMHQRAHGAAYSMRLEARPAEIFEAGCFRDSLTVAGSRSWNELLAQAGWHRQQEPERSKCIKS